MKEKYSLAKIFSKETNLRYIQLIHTSISWGLHVLAGFLALVILASIADIGLIIIYKFFASPFLRVSIDDILNIFGDFLGVLIGIEILTNILIYLQKETIQIKLVIATALVAIARKVIVFDYKTMSSSSMLSTGAVILALGITYYLLHLNKETANE